MIAIHYRVENAGWATGSIGNGSTSVQFDVSYLHDSLKELAESAIQIQFTDTQTVIFMGEPGEHRLVLTKHNNDTINFEVRAYSDWVDWVLPEDTENEIVLSGTTTIKEYKNEVLNVLRKIFSELGPELYKDKWINDDFPIDEFRELNKTANG